MQRIAYYMISAFCLISTARGEDVTAKIVVDLSNPGPAFPRTLHGIFFEDINYGADGGLYAELLQNRSFEHEESRFGWAKVGNRDRLRAYVSDDEPLHENNPHYLSLDVLADGPGVGISNRGYDRIAVKKGEKFTASIFLRSSVDSPRVKLVLVGDRDTVLAEKELEGKGGEWQKLSATSEAKDNEDDAILTVLFDKKGRYNVDMVSLFPQETFKGHANGLRSDIAQLLADLKPGFMRFPGGCIVEGRELNNAYRWKDTIGEVHERKQNWNLWADWRSPQYHQTYGLGFFEFFQLCADIGAEPVPIVNCGKACQARRGTHAPLDELKPWIHDALDLIEFANGPADTIWGAKRAAMGHREPFNMKYLGIGNEQWNEEYFERYAVFQKEIREKHPEIQLISTSGPHPDGELWSYAWQRFKTGTRADIVDEHYYRPPEWFLENDRRYDSYDRQGPKVFAGEFASHTHGRRNNLRAALAEAAFMTGLWRNADVVEMACYAPLFARIGHTQWVPDLIWFNESSVFGSPSYYVQKMYANHLPELIVKTSVEAPLVKPDEYRGRIGVGTWRTQAEFRNIKVTQGDKTLFEFDPVQGLDGWEKHNGEWDVVDGAIRQTSEAENVRLFTGSRDWSNYTITLKARKLGGAEGFLICFAATDPNTATWWNIGGWNNTEHGLELRGSGGPRVRGKIETGHWYNIRIEVAGAGVKCYLDDKLIQETSANAHPSLYAAGGFNPSLDQMVLAVVNPTGNPISTTIETYGRDVSEESAIAEILAASEDTVENSIEEPEKTITREEVAPANADNWQRNFPPYSFTILTVKTD